MKKVFATKGFSIRMLVSGIIAVVVAVILAWLSNKWLLDSIDGAKRVLQLAFVAGVIVSPIALAALFSTFYWPVTVHMIVQGCGWALSTITDFLNALSLATAGIVLFPFGVLLGLAMILVCIIIAVGPYLAIPMGILYLLTHYTPSQGTIAVIIYGSFIVVGTAYLVIFHFIIPIRNLQKFSETGVL